MRLSDLLYEEASVIINFKESISGQTATDQLRCIKRLTSLFLLHNSK